MSRIGPAAIEEARCRQSRAEPDDACCPPLERPAHGQRDAPDTRIPHGAQACSELQRSFERHALARNWISVP
eukprot:6205957-Pleurochrysis_carterae.AAC.3